METCFVKCRAFKIRNKYVLFRTYKGMTIIFLRAKMLSQNQKVKYAMISSNIYFPISFMTYIFTFDGMLLFILDL